MEENLQTQSPAPVKKSLNKTWILVAGLVILTVVLLVVSITSKGLSPILRNTPSERNEIAHTSMSISEDFRNSDSEKVESDVLINTDKDEVSGVQIKISYDPKEITNVDIAPGTFFNSPNVLIKTIDEKTGVITYVLAIKPGDKMVKGEGVVATLSFTRLGTNESYLSFLPQSQVSTTKHNRSVLKTTVSAVIPEVSN